MATKRDDTYRFITNNIDKYRKENNLVDEHGGTENLRYAP